MLTARRIIFPVPVINQSKNHLSSQNVGSCLKICNVQIQMHSCEELTVVDRLMRGMGVQFHKSQLAKWPFMLTQHWQQMLHDCRWH